MSHRLSKTLLSRITKDRVEQVASQYRPSDSCVVKVVEYKQVRGGTWSGTQTGDAPCGLYMHEPVQCSSKVTGTAHLNLFVCGLFVWQLQTVTIADLAAVVERVTKREQEVGSANVGTLTRKDVMHMRQELP